jgi:YD repeat-containing protein
MRFTHLPFRLLVSACFTLLSSLLACGQVTNVTGDQAPPIPGAGHDYIHMLNETVNPANGSVSLRIELPVPPGRGLPVPFSFAYDSNAALHMTTFPPGQGSPVPQFNWVDNTSYLAKGGWSYHVPKLSSIFSTATNGTRNNQSVCFWFADYMLTDLAGGSHALGLSSVQNITPGGQCQGAPGLPTTNYLSGADSQVQAVTTAYNPSGWVTSPVPPPVTVADLDSTTYYFSNGVSNANSIAGSTSSGEKTSLPTWVEDRNGNMIAFTDQGNGVFTITDTLGRTALSSSGFGASGNTIAVSGIPNSFQVTWLNVSSTASPLPTPYQLHDAKGTYYPPGTGPNTITSVPEISQITLPNGQSYKFQYDSVSTLLSQLTYPNGGYVQYTWSPAPAYSDELVLQATAYWVLYSSFVITKRVVSFDGVQPALEQDFSYQSNWDPVPAGMDTWSQRVTTVTTKDLVRGTSYSTVYTYQPFAVANQPNDGSGAWIGSTPVETKVQYYDIGGSLLRTNLKVYTDPQLPPNETVTLENGQTFETDYSHTPLWPNNWNSSPECWVYSFVSGTTVNRCLEILTDKYEYDLGSGARGALLRQTHLNYAGFAPTPIFPSTASILDRISQVIKYDGGGNRVAETDYGYDQTALAAVANPPSGTHDEANYGASSSSPRGNATTVTRKCFVNSTSCTDAVTSYAYDETGQAVSVTDAKNNTTNYSYADNYDSNPPPTPTRISLKLRCPPPTA